MEKGGKGVAGPPLVDLGVAARNPQLVGVAVRHPRRPLGVARGHP
jgi:hypothetical protein